MHIHILGIAGTFMGGIALIAKELGHTVSGQDKAIYPPMSEQLIKQNINFSNGYELDLMPKSADLYIIGNAISRGNKCLEYILDNNLEYTSGAKWLGDNVLKKKFVIAVSGTHGKTTTTAIISHILIQNGLNPSFLVGGVANNLGTSAKLTDSMFFVIEADEYDTAFFDKRSKFIHYYPNTLIINNIEFDHADIFTSIEDIYKEFHNLIRTLPSKATIIYPDNDKNIAKVLAKGSYCNLINFTIPKYQLKGEKTSFNFKNHLVETKLLGQHNVANINAALLACLDAGVTIEDSIKSLESFNGVKRRMEVRYQDNNLTIYDDFAHHPTSIKKTINGLRKKVGKQKIIIALELRSNTMKSGYFNNKLTNVLADADEVLILERLIKAPNVTTYKTTDAMLEKLKLASGHLIFMSNGGFNGIIDKLIKILT